MTQFGPDRPVLSIGQRASAGRTTGAARLIDIEYCEKEPAVVHGTGAVSQGDVVVADTLLPSMADTVRDAEAIVTVPRTEEQRLHSGPCCRAAVFAREIDIPAIVGAEEFRGRVTNGQRLIVDANAGEVRAGNLG